MCRKIARITANYVSDTKTVNKPNRLTPCFMLNHSPICPIAVRSILAYIRTERVFLTLTVLDASGHQKKT